MQSNASVRPTTTDIVLIGGGHAHVHVLKAFGMRPEAGVRLTVIAREVETPYSGMLPGLIAGHYRFEQCHIDLEPLARFANARLIRASAVGIDRAVRRVLVAGRPPLAYDLLSIDVGATPALDAIPGAAEHALPVKPIGRFLSRFEELRARCLADRKPRRILVIGGGAGGVELLLAARHRLRAELEAERHDLERLRYALATADDLMPTHNPRVRAAFARHLATRGVELRTHCPIARIEEGRAVTADGAILEADEILLVTQAAAPSWFADTGLALDGKGFLALGPTLQVTNDARVLGAGDCATLLHAPREKAGVFAVRQGPPLARNLRRLAQARPPRPFTPQGRFLGLISTGDRYAVASRGGWKAEGLTLWRFKDWIDRRWMRKYQELPQMAARATADSDPVSRPDAPASEAARYAATAMRCGGCGAKIGPTVLARVLARLGAAMPPDVLVGLAQPDDAALVLTEPGLAAVQTIDFFRAFVDDPYLFGEIAANHALNDVFAMAAEPRTALALVVVPYGLPDKVEEQLYQVLAGALAVLQRENVVLVGGHSSEGAELALGLAVHGVVDPLRVLRKGGLQPGDRLILTKPLGTGVLFAGAMRGKARGPWIEAALAGMRASNRAAAEVLGAHRASACTDVSGFGLAGHLTEMTQASGVTASLVLDAVPLYEGAAALAAQGIGSSLLPENLKLGVLIPTDGVERARFELLFDPQTAGGLLAGVPAERAAACLAALEAGGVAAVEIGSVLPRADPSAPAIVLAARVHAPSQPEDARTGLRHATT
jgi:selenide, water dikinase